MGFCARARLAATKTDYGTTLKLTFPSIFIGRKGFFLNWILTIYSLPGNFGPLLIALCRLEIRRKWKTVSLLRGCLIRLPLIQCHFFYIKLPHLAPLKKSFNARKKNELPKCYANAWIYLFFQAKWAFLCGKKLLLPVLLFCRWMARVFNFPHLLRFRQTAAAKFSHNRRRGGGETEFLFIVIVGNGLRLLLHYYYYYCIT